MDDIPKVYLTYDDYDALCEVISHMHFRAQNYVPTLQEIYTIITPHFPDYALLLIWIDQTGQSTVETRYRLKIIRELLYQGIVLVDSKEEIPAKVQTKDTL